MAEVHKRSSAVEEADRHDAAGQNPNLWDWLVCLTTGKPQCSAFLVDVNNHLHWCGRVAHHPGKHRCVKSW